MTEYIVCPLCGRNRVIKSNDKGNIRWDYVDLHTALLLQIRERTGGQRTGFPLIEGKTLTQLLSLPEYRVVLESLKTQLIRLVQDALDVGFIADNDML